MSCGFAHQLPNRWFKPTVLPPAGPRLNLGVRRTRRSGVSPHNALDSDTLRVARPARERGLYTALSSWPKVGFGSVPAVE